MHIAIQVIVLLLAMGAVALACLVLIHQAKQAHNQADARHVHELRCCHEGPPPEPGIRIFTGDPTQDGPCENDWCDWHLTFDPKRVS